MTSKFAKYVPEADKKKQREHIGAVGMNDLPFGEEVETVELVPEEKIIVYDMYGIHLATTKPEMVEGQTYTVIFDGEEYPCVCTIYNGMGGIVYRLGNYNVVVSSAEDTGEPFWMEFEAWGDTPKIYVRADDFDKEHTVAVHSETIIIKTIDPKYLPVMTVTLQRVSGENTFTSDKTYDEIMACLDRGYEVICMYKTSSAATPERAYLRLYLDGAIYFVRFSLISDLEKGIVETFTITNMIMTADGTNYWAQSAISISA